MQVRGTGYWVSPAKISFHTDGNWQMQTGQNVIRFVATRSVSEKWLHALSLQWYFSPGVFEPHVKGPEPAELVEVAENSMLVISLLQTIDDSSPQVPAVLGGRILWRERLRGGRSILLHAATVRQTDSDRRYALRVRQKITASVKTWPLQNVYAEATEIYSGLDSFNLLAITPLGLDSFRFDDPNATGV